MKKPAMATNRCAGFHKNGAIMCTAVKRKQEIQIYVNEMNQVVIRQVSFVSTDEDQCIYIEPEDIGAIRAALIEAEGDCE